jgi:predicted  nucleic acid-binding Zn-ribbon protein
MSEERADGAADAMLRHSIASLTHSEAAGLAADELLRLSVASATREDESNAAIRELIEDMVAEVCALESRSREMQERWRVAGTAAAREAATHRAFTNLAGYSEDGSDDPNAILAALNRLLDERVGIQQDVAAAGERWFYLREEEIPARELHLQMHVRRWGGA